MQRPMSAELVDRKKVAVMGGSHGKTLTGNLVGQYPAAEALACGVPRNPDVDLGLMIHCSDTPDCLYIEAFGSKGKLEDCGQGCMSNNVSSLTGACLKDWLPQRRSKQVVSNAEYLQANVAYSNT